MRLVTVLQPLDDAGFRLYFHHLLAAIMTDISKGIALADEQLLAELGYKQEFKRAFSPVQVFGIAFSIM